MTDRASTLPALQQAAQPRSQGRDLARRALAEAVGTFALVFIGCGAVRADALTGGALGPVGIALAFGAVITTMIMATGHISGAHFNPAVTLAFASIGQIRWREVPAYVLAQGAAAVLGAAAVAGLGDSTVVGATTPSLPLSQAFVVETIITFFLMFVITAVATDKRAPQATAGLAIGGTVMLAALVCGGHTGASMNPARSLGPALFDSLEFLWLYFTAPVLGAVLGAWTYRVIQGPARSR